MYCKAPYGDTHMYFYGVILPISRVSANANSKIKYILPTIMTKDLRLFMKESHATTICLKNIETILQPVRRILSDERAGANRCVSMCVQLHVRSCNILHLL